MKRRIILMGLCLPLLVVSASAQTTVAGGTTFGFRAGVNFQNLTGKDFAGHSLEYKLKPGFNAGVNAEIPVAPDYFVQPGILFSTKGAKYNSPDYKVNVSYI